jgi:hypothetical protein
MVLNELLACQPTETKVHKKKKEKNSKNYNMNPKE